MTVPAQDTRVTYTASGSSDTFAYPFRILSSADLLVYIDDVLQTLTTDYTVTGVDAEDGGNVVFTADPDADATVVIMRNMDYGRTEFDYQVSGSFRAETINRDLDSLALQIQQLAEKISRAPTLTVATLLAGIAFPSPGASQYIRWNADGTALEAVSSLVSSGRFVQSGDGAVEMEANAKMAEIVSTKDFGASPSASGTENAAAFNRAVRHGATFILCTRGEYDFNPRYMLYDDGSYSQATRVGVSIPSNRVLFGYGVTLNVENTNSDSYSVLASYNTSNVHLCGFTLVGDRDANTSNPAVPNDYGFGIDFRDVTDCSVENVISNKMWGDSFYLGVTDTSGTGSNRVTYRNITGINSRRQGLSITGGQKITVDGYRFEDITGASNGPCAGIDIEPNTTDYANDITLKNGFVEGCNRSVQAFKAINLNISDLQVEDCIVLFPIMSDRCYDVVMSNIQCRGGSTTNYGILWQETPDLSNIQVNGFSISGCDLYALYVSDTASHGFADVTFRNGKIFFKDDVINTSYVSSQSHGGVAFQDVDFIIPSGFDAGDAASLSPANYILESINCIFKKCDVTNKGSASLIFDVSPHGNRGNTFTNISFTKDALSLQNSWAAETGYEAPYYLKNSDNEVSLYGAMDSGTATAGTLLFTLPAGFRPSATVFAPIVVRDGGATVEGKGVTIDTDGTCVLTDNVGNNRVSLNGIKFMAGG